MSSATTPWQHRHDFHRLHGRAERGTRLVLWITLATMVLEVTAGWWLGSMALLADGWHMGSHAVAIGVSVLAYAASRRLQDDARFAFGTWKIEVLGGFASALLLLGVAALMALASLQRLFDPQPIHFREAVAVAVVGLLVNVVCALILGRAHHDEHDHGHTQGHGHGHDHHHGHASAHAQAAGHPAPRAASQHHDLNLRSAYLHVLADALTSVLAIVALVGGWVGGWVWLDPVMGLVGAVLIAVWARGLVAQTSRVLLDREMDHPVVPAVRRLFAHWPGDDSLQLTDLHVWRVGRNAYACTLTLVTRDPALTPERVHQALAAHPELVHSTVEIHRRA